MKKNLVIGVIIGLILGINFETEIKSSLDFLSYHDKRIEEDLDLDLLNEVYDVIHEKYVDPQIFIEKEPFEYGIVKGLIYGLDDPYSSFMTPEENKDFMESLDGNFEGIGAELTLKEGLPTIVTPLKNSPAAKAGLLPGDIILKVDGKEIQDTPLKEVVNLIRGESDTEVVLNILRPSEVKNLDISVKRGVIEIPSIESKILDNKIGYIEINQFGAGTDNEFFEHFKKLKEEGIKGIILDLRFNGGGFLDSSIKLLSTFFEEEKTGVIVKTKNKEETREIRPYTFSDEKIPLVVLQNKGSASASEIVAGALQDYARATIIGEDSFGKGTVQEVVDLPRGSSLRITIAKWLTPNRREINEEGIKPDIVVEKTEEDYREEKTPQLDKAIEVLMEKMKKD